MEGKLTICFSAPATSPAATAPTVAETAEDRSEAPGGDASPPRAAGDALSPRSAATAERRSGRGGARPGGRT